MTDHTTPFLKRLQGITLSDNERLQMRERLAAYTDMHPMPAPLARATFGAFSLFTARHLTVVMTALVLIVGAGSGVTLAADQSVPGDALYALKINVNEPLMSALAPTDVGQAKAAATIATRRVDEAVTLASRGDLTPDKQAYLSHAFTSSVERAAKKTDAIASSGNADGANTVKANFAADLANEAQALGAVSTTDTKARSELLRAVVATTESFADTSEGGSAVLAVEQAHDTDTGHASATAATFAAPTASVRAAMLMKASATASTTVRTVAAPTTVRHLHVTEMELRTFASSTVRARLFAPKADVAIPAMPTAADVTEGNLHLGQ
jgi:hypothetical protein